MRDEPYSKWIGWVQESILIRLKGGPKTIQQLEEEIGKGVNIPRATTRLMQKGYLTRRKVNKKRTFMYQLRSQELEKR